MFESGIYYLSQLYDSKFYTKTLLDSKNKQNVNLDEFIFEKQNLINLKLEHIQLAIKLWIICICITFIFLSSEILFSKLKAKILLHND